MTLYNQQLTTSLDDLLTATQLELKCEQIEETIKVTLGKQQSRGAPATSKRRMPTSETLTRLIGERRDTTCRDGATRSRLTKLIRREVRAVKRATRRSEIESILKEYRGLQKISGIKSYKVKDLIPSMTSADGQTQHNRQSIADVFATFYEQLYKDSDKHNDTTQTHNENNDDRIPAFTAQELGKALGQLKTGKAADSNGIVAEMLKAGGHTLREVLLNLYNAITQPSSPSPNNWHHTIIKVLHKSGPPQLPQNYRPIATIPILYKLFARLLYNRLEPTLDKQQSCDQAGFRRERGTTNHLFTISMLQEISDEWQIPLWVAAVDFKKAFDSVTHSAIWRALSEQGVSPSYIQLLNKLYNNQTASVKTDTRSRLFNIERGTKQGDPLSSLLFNCVSESVMRQTKLKWNSKHWGVPLQPHHTDNTQLTNLRFADDLLLVATSLEHLKQMIGDLSMEASRVGLQLHPDKTKILHNQATRRKPQPKHVNIKSLSI